MGGTDNGRETGRMSLRGRLNRLERDAHKELIEIPLRDGTVKRFPKSALMGAFLHLVGVAVGGASLPEEPEIFEALRNARDPAQEWMGTFYFDPADITAAEPVPDLSE
jgi:hypothetical protein